MAGLAGSDWTQGANQDARNLTLTTGGSGHIAEIMMSTLLRPAPGLSKRLPGTAFSSASLLSFGISRIEIL
jgi:hypothetical protein